MKFDFCIGNPPYQENSAGEKISDASLYAEFMDAAYTVADRVELVTPARFLFDNGNTSSSWNKKMLNDEHFKVLLYESDSSKIFPKPIDIKGGVAIHYRDVNREYGAIGCFTSFPELNNILKKVTKTNPESIMKIIYNQNRFNLDNLYVDYPNLKNVISSDGRERRMTSGCIVYPCFSDSRNAKDDIQIMGYTGAKRVNRYINRKYVDVVEDCNLEKYKVIIPANNGAGSIGEVLSNPIIGKPFMGFTQTFISFGSYDNQDVAENTMKYIKTKFARTLLSVLKVTQNGKKPVWKHVPLQNFTSDSDIDWRGSVAEIDKQLYKKYKLSKEEINFIETHVKEMV